MTDAGPGPFWAYVLTDPQQRFYIGSTGDLQGRIQRHNDPDRPKSAYTAKSGPWELVWAESHPTRAEAMAREQQIKSMKSARWIREYLLNG